jgi:hypothetical protein
MQRSGNIWFSGRRRIRSIELLVVQIVDRSKCLGRFSIFSGSNSGIEQNALDVFPGLIQEFWIRFQLRPENKIKHKNYNKTLYIQYELGLTNANKGVLNQTIQDLSVIPLRADIQDLSIFLCIGLRDRDKSYFLQCELVKKERTWVTILRLWF